MKSIFSTSAGAKMSSSPVMASIAPTATLHRYRNFKRFMIFQIDRASGPMHPTSPHRTTGEA